MDSKCFVCTIFYLYKLAVFTFQTEFPFVYSYIVISALQIECMICVSRTCAVSSYVITLNMGFCRRANNFHIPCIG